MAGERSGRDRSERENSSKSGFVAPCTAWTMSEAKSLQASTASRAPWVVRDEMAAAAAAALILAFGGWQLMTGSPAVPPVVQAGPANVVEYVEAELLNHSHFSWTDESSGATVIWVDEWTDEGEEAGG